MFNATVQEAGVETEAGKLQVDLRDVFSKILSHARRIDMTMTMGDGTGGVGADQRARSISRKGP
jgi:hypothetical protein